MQKLVPRDYQLITTELIWKRIDAGVKRIAAALATGLGKGLCIADIVANATMQEMKVLVMVHRREIVAALKKEIADYCGLDELQIGIEQAEQFAPTMALVVVASTDTIVKENRLQWFKPDMIITDECQRGSTPSNLAIYERFGVNEGRCIHVGFSATVFRADKKALFAKYVDGTPYIIEVGKAKRKVKAKAEDCLFDELVVDYDTTFGMDNGWLVDARTYTCETDTEIGDIPRNADGEFNQKKLAKRINNSKRTNKVINFWKELCPTAQTMVFCADVQHALDTAELWREAGFTAQEIDGKTDKMIRDRHVLEFNAGKLQVLVNCDCFTEGTNLPKCNCVVLLKPTRWWGRFIQMIGRGLRPWPGLLDKLQNTSAVERLMAIACSEKPFCYLIDAYDITDDDEVCHPPALVGLPNTLRAEGESLREVNKKVKELCAETGRDITECPINFEEVEVIIGRHKSLHSNTRVRKKEEWEPTAQGYKFVGSRPGYSADLLFSEEGKRLVIRKGSEILLNVKAKETASNGEEFDLHTHLNKAGEKVNITIAQHADANPVNRFTTGKWSDKQIAAYCRMYKCTPVEMDHESYQAVSNKMLHMFSRFNSSRKKETA